jgi:hypothetical protein
MTILVGLGAVFYISYRYVEREIISDSRAGWSFHPSSEYAKSMEIEADGIFFVLNDDEQIQTTDQKLFVQNTKKPFRFEFLPPQKLVNISDEAFVAKIRSTLLNFYGRQKVDFSHEYELSESEVYAFGLNRVQEDSGVWNVRMDIIIRKGTAYMISTLSRTNLAKHPSIETLEGRIAVRDSKPG